MLNKIDIMGRLTRDPELRYTQSQTAVCSFCVACDRDFRDRDGERPTDFINVTAWRQTAEFVSRFFRKGDMIIISGRLQMRDWTDNSGNRRTVAEVLAESVYFGGTKREEAASDPADGGTHFHDIDDGDGELPF